MIFRLMRSDLIWCMGPALALANLIVLPLFPTARQAGSLLPIEAFTLCFVLMRFQGSRATLFEMALPIPARQIFLARTLSLMGLVWLPALSAAAVLSALFPQILKGAVIATLAVLLPLCVRLPERSLPSWLTAALGAGVAGAGLAAWYLLPSWAVLLLFGAASLVVFLRTWFALPPSFQAAPLQAVRATGHTALPGVLPAHWRPIVRSLPWQSLGMFPLMAMLAPSGGFFSFVAMMSISMYAQVRNRLRWLSVLAISPRSLLLITLAASVGPMVGGIVLGTCLGRWNPMAGGSVDRPPSVGTEAFAYGQDAMMPLEFWRLAPGGKAPPIRAPWGETAQPLTITILGRVFYNPYSGYHASPRFVEWQWMQASQDLHLGRIPLSQYWPTRTAPHPVVFTGDVRFRTLALAVLLVYVLYAVFVGEFSRWHKLGLPSRFWSRILLCGLLGLPVAAPLAAIFYSFESVALARTALFLFEQALPDSVPLVTLLAALPVAALYWLLQWQFRQSELLGPLTKPEAA
jgi:hypothetical protein